jgi:hypothetical protein
MTTTIECKTLFDITATGVRNHYKSSKLPFTADNNRLISDMESWTQARNQQRNWETLVQIISLRTLPEDITTPVCVTENNKNHWKFTFSVPSIESFYSDNDSLGSLFRDCVGVPMISGLNETSEIAVTLTPTGNDANIWFCIVQDK